MSKHDFRPEGQHPPGFPGHETIEDRAFALTSCACGTSHQDEHPASFHRTRIEHAWSSIRLRQHVDRYPYTVQIGCSSDFLSNVKLIGTRRDSHPHLLPFGLPLLFGPHVPSTPSGSRIRYLRLRRPSYCPSYPWRMEGEYFSPHPRLDLDLIQLACLVYGETSLVRNLELVATRKRYSLPRATIHTMPGAHPSTH